MPRSTPPVGAGGKRPLDLQPQQCVSHVRGRHQSDTIVWIATGFRSEHRAAIDWLNERTDENTRFFGVEIQVVRIGGSLPAPAFKLVAQPNDWGKHKASTASSETSETAVGELGDQRGGRTQVGANHAWTHRPR